MESVTAPPIVSDLLEQSLGILPDQMTLSGIRDKITVVTTFDTERNMNIDCWHCHNFTKAIISILSYKEQRYEKTKN